MQANYSRRMNSKEVSVGGEIYVLYPFPAFTAANLSGEIAGLLLPAVGALAPLFKDKKLSLDDDLNVLAFHVLKENFGGFFERVGSLFGERGQDQAAPMTQSFTAI